MSVTNASFCESSPLETTGDAIHITLAPQEKIKAGNRNIPGFFMPNYLNIIKFKQSFFKTVAGTKRCYFAGVF
ncbi:hypothetical protein SAMN04488024_10730 [Pedobacter soli]|uniref:Uncharacterized protein n=2 Tax=Pedobacter soli TaxID=390242 RepID=A0A1G6WKM5_9SPHI|nr:hypothetical protein SAMN04488024_10730 [Pedobacter soli]